MSVTQICENNGNFLLLIIGTIISAIFFLIIFRNVQRFQRDLLVWAERTAQEKRERGYTVGDDGELFPSIDSSQTRDARKQKAKESPTVMGCLSQQLIIAVIGLLTAIISALAVTNPLISLTLESTCMNILGDLSAPTIVAVRTADPFSTPTNQIPTRDAATATVRSSVTPTLRVNPTLEPSTLVPETIVPAQEISPTLPLRLLFYGYPTTGNPQSGLAQISQSGLTNIENISFTQVGGDISPDGQLIAFDNCSSPNRGIYVATLNGSNARMISSVGGNTCVYVEWSPDGRFLAYNIGDQNGSIVILNVSTGEETSLDFPYVGWVSWSPNGQEIVFESGRGGDRQLYITDLLGNARELTSSTDLNCNDVWAPEWAPDGTLIVFTACDGLYTITPSGEELTSLGVNGYAPEWSPESHWIYYLQPSTENPRTLMRINVMGTIIDTIGVLPYYGGPFSLGVS